MPAHNVDFAGEIRRIAAATGRAPTPAQVADLNASLQSLADFDQETNVVSLPGGEAIDAFVRREAHRFDASTAGPTIPAPLSSPGAAAWAHGRTDTLASLAQSFDRAHNAAVAAEAASWGNPWAKGQENRTQQAILKNHDPARAARLQAEAGR